MGGVPEQLARHHREGPGAPRCGGAKDQPQPCAGGPRALAAQRGGEEKTKTCPRGGSGSAPCTQKSEGNGGGGAAPRSAACRQNGQWSSDGSGAGAVSAPCAADAVGSRTHCAPPVALQISTAVVLRAQASARDTAGASMPSTSHEQHQAHRPGAMQRRGANTPGQGHADDGLRAGGHRPQPLAGAAPGALTATGSLSSVLLCTPLASLNTRVSGMVVSFCSGSFRSSSITW